MPRLHACALAAGIESGQHTEKSMESQHPSRHASITNATTHADPAFGIDRRRVDESDRRPRARGRAFSGARRFVHDRRRRRARKAAGRCSSRGACAPTASRSTIPKSSRRPAGRPTSFPPRWTRDRSRPPYALVTLLIGVNNQYRGRERRELSRANSPHCSRARSRSRASARITWSWFRFRIGASPVLRAANGRDPRSHRDRDRRVQRDRARDRARSRQSHSST